MRNLIILPLLLMMLTGCISSESIDQGGHRVQGYALACELSRWGTSEQRVKIVMDFARAREALQHPVFPGEPPRCGKGCKLDLENWEKGARAGAVCYLEKDRK